MPPLLPQDSDNILVKSPEPYYTNDDVAILHDIVVRAQDLLPSLPERERLPTNALFHAYYSILPSIGINVDHDSRYARILFKIGGTRSDGSLYEKFEAVLARMGIEIQFDHDKDGEGEGGTIEEGSGRGSDLPVYAESILAVTDQSRAHNRSIPEIQALESRQNYGEDSSSPRVFSSASTARSEIVVNRIDTLYDSSNENHQPSPRDLPQTASHGGEQGEEKDYGLGAWLNDSIGKYPKPTQTRSPSAHGSIRIGRRSPPNVKKTSILHPASDDFSAADVTHQKHLDAEGIIQPTTFALTSENLMDAKATMIKKLRAENLARQILFRWHQEATELKNDNSNLETLARHQDRRVLIRQAFDSWHIGIGERRRIAETERFFAHLERRAGRARELFLVAKALTHWAYSASNEIQRTSAARRHILRIRYFSAWLDTTTVNELKVRRQVLRKFFPIWQRQHVTTSVYRKNAVVYFTDNLVRRIFWAWFWAFCERRAPVWRSNRLLRRQLAVWVRKTSEWRMEDAGAVACYHQTTREKTYFVWSTNAHDQAMQIRQATKHRIVSLCSRTLEVWRHQSALLVRLQHLHERLDSRHKQDSLKLWNLRARQESHARAIDQSKIVGEAWATWNGKLRCRSLQFKISDRLVLRGLYKWALAERLLLVRRLMEHRMMRICFQKLTETLQRSTAKNSKDLHVAEERFFRGLTISTIRTWRARLNNYRKHQRVAVEFKSPLSLHNSLARWCSQSRRIGRLQAWARDGEFYFLASKAVKSWKIAKEQAKRDKRSLAYTQFRRRYKIGLARRIFSRWHRQANFNVHLDRVAAEVNQNKSVVVFVEAFHRLRARIEEIAELNLMWERSLLEKHLNRMKLSLVYRHALETEAGVFFQEHKVALSTKRWGRMYLQLRARQHLVFELREKHLRRISRRVLAHWLQRTSHLQRLVGNRHPEKSNSRYWQETVSWIGSVDDRNVEEWSDGVDDATTSTPMPRYLHTPSRKLPRAKATTRISSTTPSAPLSTPVERQLRAQYSGGPLPSFRRRIGRSLLGKEGTTLDIEEESKIWTQEEVNE